MPRLKLREFILFRGAGNRASIEPKGEPAHSDRAVDTLHAGMEKAGVRLKQALAVEHELNRTLRKKSRFGAADLERMRECRKAVEDCAEVYLAAVRRWRTALQDEISAAGPTARPAQTKRTVGLPGRMSGNPFSLEVAPNFQK